MQNDDGRRLRSPRRRHSVAPLQRQTVHRRRQNGDRADCHGTRLRRRYRASSRGYFPADNPKYSCVVVVADTKSGSYYGSAIAAPVFREVPDLIYATDPAFPAPWASRGQSVRPRVQRRRSYRLGNALPGTRYANHTEGVKSDWVNVKTGTEEAALTPIDMPEFGVPDVRGMGLRDALYLLENAGLNVDYNGIGTVRFQSIAPGTPTAHRTHHHSTPSLVKLLSDLLYDARI